MQCLNSSSMEELKLYVSLHQSHNFWIGTWCHIFPIGKYCFMRDIS
jgi:hypothetical protein